MKKRQVVWALVMIGAAASMGFAQTPARGPARGAAAPAAGTQAHPAQLMRGICYPASNVIFAAQDTNPNDVPPAKDPATSPNPLASTYGKWTAVENASLAIAEASRLLTTPGRKCSNGRAVPLQNPDWAKF